MSNEKERDIDAAEIISRGEKFAERYANVIIYCILGVIVVAFGIWAYIQYVSKPREAKASAELFRSEERFILGEDSTVLQATGVSEEGVLRIINDYSSTDAANLSHVYAGIAYYDLGKYEESLAELKKFSAKDQMVAPSVIRLMGDCCVELDRLEDAVKYFEKAASMANNEVVSPGCLVKAARVYEVQKNYSKAIDAYQKIVDEYYNSAEVNQAKADITRLQVLQN
ncbi:tetratricopeptide repeat protein [Porphyromonas circumdentaria]|uniref:Tetratricopeptide repeat-containing protein n=1 Tax=Porphyromonas circumdentaria TaxID=29524 RepID=A0A1T4NZU7_9PORP|nr:tetratricopeptide repeat protein [Porphyromonas circumdentaria]MBB6276257.1 tetratricopeptide (TPR) repeat protein [Porphyromonas circumdentaria]MDO4722271.1 tetratricopeptide repeat protein [Porphyromonas circumdentaria]SJZ84910.1 Tetratricopeptide repeat-containing protein [Porphyromonas circumdentaria]